MRKFINIKYITPLVLAIMLTTSCNESFLDVNDNPNAPKTATLNFLLPGALVASGFWTNRTLMERSSVFSQHWYSLSGSTYNVQPGDTSGDFDGIYTNALKELAAVEAQSTDEGLTGYRGIARVMKAYLFSILVDNFGDVPYTEALQGESILFPMYDDDAAIYADLLNVLEDAKTDLNDAIAAGEVISGDVIYSGSLENWLAAANTIKLRLYMNTRLVDATASATGIEALITEDNFISTNAENFQFLYGSALSPLQRHPIYFQEYVGGDKGFYMSNYFMWRLFSKNDPRLPYYIFKQGNFSDMNFDTTPCSNRAPGACPYWELLCNGCNADVNNPTNTAATGLLGRDAGDDGGIPGDNTIRATFGVYPIGGSYDDGSGGDRSAASTTGAAGGSGAGVMPWLTNSTRAFMLAESALILGTSGDARALFEEGIRQSMNHVSTFSQSVSGSNAVAMPQADIDAYVTSALADYDAAVLMNDQAVLNVIITEKHSATFGNGFEAYNDMRRTGYPSDMPASISPSGPFPVRFQLPVVSESGINPNAPDPAPTVVMPVFWDI